MTSDSVLGEIIEKAGKADLPWFQWTACGDISSEPLDARVFFADSYGEWEPRCEYAVLAANHAPALAAELQAAREKLAKVRQLAERFADERYDAGYRIVSAVILKEVFDVEIKDALKGPAEVEAANERT